MNNAANTMDIIETDNELMVMKFCNKIRTPEQATNVLNWIDGQADAEKLWAVVLEMNPNAMSNDLIVKKFCSKARTLKQATILWNWIDEQLDPEPLWAMMAKMMPSAFSNPNSPNTIKFTY